MPCVVVGQPVRDDQRALPIRVVLLDGDAAFGGAGQRKTRPCLQPQGQVAQWPQCRRCRSANDAGMGMTAVVPFTCTVPRVGSLRAAPGVAHGAGVEAVEHNHRAGRGSFVHAKAGESGQPSASRRPLTR